MAIGVTQQRLDAVAKVTGRARYTDDLGMPGMRHAAYVRSPRAHALVRSIDTAEALALPGVEAVFTAADVPRRRFATAGHPYSLDPAGADVADRRLLTDHARYHGDEVAIVVARDLLTARKAGWCGWSTRSCPCLPTPKRLWLKARRLFMPGGGRPT